jgi:hypothetical protein
MTDNLNRMVFEIRAIPSAQTVLKLLNHFALRDILPNKVKWETSDVACIIMIETDDLSIEIAEATAEKMRSQVNVEAVSLRH